MTNPAPVQRSPHAAAPTRAAAREAPDPEELCELSFLPPNLSSIDSKNVLYDSDVVKALHLAAHRHTAATAPIAAASATSGREGAVVRHFVGATRPRAARPWWRTGYAAVERSGRPPQVNVAAGRKGALSVFGLERNTHESKGLIRAATRDTEAPPERTAATPRRIRTRRRDGAAEASMCLGPASAASRAAAPERRARRLTSGRATSRHGRRGSASRATPNSAQRVRTSWW